MTLDPARRVLLGAVSWLSAHPALGPALAGGAMVAYGVIAATVLLTVRRHHPFAAFGPANVVTSLRSAVAALLVGFVVALSLAGGGAGGVHQAAKDLFSGGEGGALVALLVGVLALDGVDGFLARRSGKSSVFGARFDMEIDALTILCLSFLVVVADRAGAFAVLIGLARYLFVAAAVAVPALAGPLAPSKRRQSVCVLQYVALIAALAPGVSGAVGSALVGAALAALLVSFAIDVAALLRQAPERAA